MPVFVPSWRVVALESIVSIALFAYGHWIVGALFGLGALNGAFRRASVRHSAPSGSDSEPFAEPPGTPAPSIPEFGPYSLDMNKDGLAGLVELSAAEKLALGAAVEFKDERIFHASPVTFSGVEWQVILGTVNDSVYKISGLRAFAERAIRDGVWQGLDSKFRQALGASERVDADIVIWSGREGNVVMNRGKRLEEHLLVLTMTSRSVRAFERAR